MRLDNPIYNHKFKNLPDIASLPELKGEYRSKKKIDLSNLYLFLKQQNLSKFNKELDSIIYSTYSEAPKLNGEDEETKKWRSYLNKYFVFYKNFKPKSQKLKNNDVYDGLYNQGFKIIKLDTNNLINKDIEKKYRLLTSRKDWRPPPGTFDRWKDLNNLSIQNVNNAFVDRGIIKACEHYYSKKNMRVSTVRLTVGRSTDNHWKQFLYDCKKITKYTNLHIDPSEGVVKAMIYLNKVNKGNGETSFLPKSNRFVYDPLQSLFSRAIAVGSYCHNPISRRSVFRLPKKLRVTTNIGRLVDDKSNLKKYLDKNLVSLTSKVGNTLIFDPGAGMHNGGVVKKGERIALQVVIE